MQGGILQVFFAFSQCNVCLSLIFERPCEFTRIAFRLNATLHFGIRSLPFGLLSPVNSLVYLGYGLAVIKIPDAERDECDNEGEEIAVIYQFKQNPRDAGPYHLRHRTGETILFPRCPKVCPVLDGMNNCRKRRGKRKLGEGKNSENNNKFAGLSRFKADTGN